MSATQEKCRRIGEWLGWLALPGLAVSVVSIIYSIYAWRTSPESPDQAHSVERVEHGRRRYLTPTQDMLSSRVPLIGFVEALLVGSTSAILCNGCRLNVTTRSKKKGM